MEDIKGKVIIISPLDWGMGHASRCVQIIRELLQHNTIIIGVTALNEKYFLMYFPEITQVKLPTYGIRYSKFWPVYLKLVFQWPSIHKTICAENQWIKEFVLKNKVDLIISDNRFGLWHPKIKSVFITHQLKIKLPFLAFFANIINRRYIHYFSEVWTPDFADRGKRLSGELSNSSHYKIPVQFIGPKSALTGFQQINTTNETIELLILLSGIEPQRSLIETELIAQLDGQQRKIVLIRGVQNAKQLQLKTIECYDVLFGESLAKMVLTANTIICRSGYSTLMDLFILRKKKLVLIPTPGQTEQEYLAEYWNKNFGAQVYKQGKIGKL